MNMYMKMRNIIRMRLTSLLMT